MSAGASSADGRLSRRARVSAVALDSVDVVWLESQCRGCTGCQGRCGLFAKSQGEAERLTFVAPDVVLGQMVMVSMPADGLRRTAVGTYGLATGMVLAGAVSGHVIGEGLGFPNAAALVGLVAGTFLAGWMTKRWVKAPQPELHAASDPDPDFD